MQTVVQVLLKDNGKTIVLNIKPEDFPIWVGHALDRKTAYDLYSQLREIFQDQEV
jgi:hypothetical protein